MSIRRFFILLEQSIKQSIERFLLEPNDIRAWKRVRELIEGFLLSLWRQGAFKGAQPSHAFNVAVGLGETMTKADIAEGRMFIRIFAAMSRVGDFSTLSVVQQMPPS